MQFCLLASGSKGNATYVAGSQGAVLIDCGLSARELLKRMALRNLAVGNIRAIIVTHEHRDHMGGVSALARKLKLPVIATAPTLRKAAIPVSVKTQYIASGEMFNIGDLAIHPFSICHDAADPVGLVFTQGCVRLGMCTDLGYTSNLVRSRLANCHGLILESNHDPAMLNSGPYPSWLKQRVRSRQGHLSNQECARLLGELDHPDLQTVTLAHLSETNNKPELARQAWENIGRHRDAHYKLEVADQNIPSPVLEI